MEIEDVDVELRRRRRRGGAGGGGATAIRGLRGLKMLEGYSRRQPNSCFL